MKVALLSLFHLEHVWIQAQMDSRVRRAPPCPAGKRVSKIDDGRQALLLRNSTELRRDDRLRLKSMEPSVLLLTKHVVLLCLRKLRQNIKGACGFMEDYIDVDCVYIRYRYVDGITFPRPRSALGTEARASMSTDLTMKTRMGLWVIPLLSRPDTHLFLAPCWSLVLQLHYIV